MPDRSGARNGTGGARVDGQACSAEYRPTVGLAPFSQNDLVAIIHAAAPEQTKCRLCKKRRFDRYVTEAVAGFASRTLASTILPLSRRTRSFKRTRASCPTRPPGSRGSDLRDQPIKKGRKKFLACPDVLQAYPESILKGRVDERDVKHSLESPPPARIAELSWLARWQRPHQARCPEAPLRHLRQALFGIRGAERQA